jgi:predicted Na+-dependent transporter
VPLVQLTMLGMGLTLTAADFRRVLATPVVVALGVVAQFGIMPLAGWAFTRLFGLTGEVAAGLILVGSCPGGVASDVITYVARANVPLSVTLTDLRRVGLPLFAAAVCHNAAGFLLGYAAARLARLDARDSRTVSIEVGMQNCGMATALVLRAADGVEGVVRPDVERAVGEERARAVLPGVGTLNGDVLPRSFEHVTHNQIADRGTRARPGECAAGGARFFAAPTGTRCRQ